MNRTIKGIINELRTAMVRGDRALAFGLLRRLEDELEKGNANG